MKTLLIDSFGNITREGLTIHFNQKFSENDGLATDEWWVSWDKIGKALCGDKYCEETEVAKLRELRKVNPVDALVIRQGEMVTNIAGILEDVKATYSGDRYIKERLDVAIKRVNGLRPIDIIKEALDEFNDAMIDILPEDFDGKKVNAIYDKILNALSV
jgi:hypothetical protein